MTRIVWIVTVGSVADGSEFIKLKEWAVKP